MKIFGFDDYRVLNERFNSGKLRNIIQQHGMPKYKQDRKFLFDLQDDEIFGVMDYDEWYDFYRDNKNSYRITLEDGKYLVLGNIDTFKYYVGEDDFQAEFKKRRDERHPGNKLNDVPSHARRSALEDEATKHFREKKAELEHRRNLEKFKIRLGDDLEKFVDEIRTNFESNIDNQLGELILDYKGKHSDEINDEFDIEFNGATYNIYYDYTVSVSDGYEKSGATYYDVTISPESVGIYADEFEDEFDSSELFDDPNKLLADYDVDDVEGEISDYYEYYGVSWEDFL